MPSPTYIYTRLACACQDARHTERLPGEQPRGGGGPRVTKRPDLPSEVLPLKLYSLLANRASRSRAANAPNSVVSALVSASLGAVMGASSRVVAGTSAAASSSSAVEHQMNVSSALT